MPRQPLHTAAALNATSITNIESKTDHIASQAVDLDDVEQQANRLKTLPSPSIEQGWSC